MFSFPHFPHLPRSLSFGTGLRLAALSALAVGAVDCLEAPLRGRPVRPTIQRRAPSDTAKADSLRKDSTHALVKWVEADSIASALMNRPGYSVTRYQGLNVQFDAKRRVLYLEGSPANGRAAVGRAGTILVGDTITYNDSTKLMVALGDTLVLRDPTRGSADVVALGGMTYNVEQRRGTVTNISTSSGKRRDMVCEGAVATYRQ